MFSKNVFFAPKCKCSPFVRASHLQASLCVSYREVCGAIACTDAAAIRYLGSRSPGSWREEQHPTPPPPPPPPRPDTLPWPPCRGRTWSRRTAARLFSWPPQLPALQRTGADLITLPLVWRHSLLPQRIQQGHNVSHREESSVWPMMKSKKYD